MEDRKLRRRKAEVESNVKTNKPKKKLNKLDVITKGLGVITAALTLAIFAIVIYLKVLPNKYLIPLCVIAIGAEAAGIIAMFKNKTSKLFKQIALIIYVILTIILVFVSAKLIKTMQFLSGMDTTTVNSKTYSVVVLKDSEYKELGDLQYKLLRYCDNELGNMEPVIQKLSSAITLVTETTDDVHKLAEGLLNKETDAILIEDSYYSMIEENVPDFKDKILVLYTFAMEDTIPTIAKDVSVTKQPFSIYISGIDTYGTISSVSRSDVNMVVTVNPETKQILLTNIPRDYYVQLHGTSGYRDKLTHAGIYGVEMSVKTLEDLFKTDINYYIRVNFTSVVKIIDAIGGVNVYSKYAFTSRLESYKFAQGYNQLNGERALSFARERYSFNEGDRMRGENQQALIDAMIKKVCSSSTILTKFDALLDSLKGSFQTNMDYTKMLELVKMQISDNAEWKVTSIGLDGIGSTERTYSTGKTLLYVMIPYAGSINKAKTMLNAVLNGEGLETGHIDITSYNDYGVVSRGTYPSDAPVVKEPETEVKPEQSGSEVTPTDSTPTAPADPEPTTPTDPEPTTPVDPEPTTPTTPTDPEPTTPTDPEPTTPVDPEPITNPATGQ